MAKFINIMPTNDRREISDYRGEMENCLKVSGSFLYTLVTVGDGRLDPWVVAQRGMHLSQEFSPLIAVNPLYQHPLSVAKRVASLRALYPNRIAINLVSGSFFHEMERLGDCLGSEDRNDRLRDFLSALNILLSAGTPKKYEGRYYQFRDIQLFPQDGRQVDCFISGSVAGISSAPNHFFVKNVRPGATLPVADACNTGLAFGICARENRDAARMAAQLLYPENRKGRMLYDMTASNQQTPWNKWLRENADKDFGLYSLLPAKNFWSAAPFLIGSYEEVAQEISRLKAMGYGFFLVDFNPSEFLHVQRCLALIRPKGSAR
jgi:alkanesulfonate monooxygenase